MGAEIERRLLARAHQLADVEDLAEDVTGILGGGRAARLDPDALRGLACAALALGAGSLAVYRAEAPRFTGDRQFAAAAEEAEAEIAARAGSAARARAEAGTALDSAYEALDDGHGALEAARRMATSQPCDGCHGAKAAAIAAAQARIEAARDRIGYAEAAAGLLDELGVRIQRALTCIRRVPADLAEVYEPVYDHVRAGRVMPRSGDFLAGKAS
jgi:hypothetical protein